MNDGRSRLVLAAMAALVLAVLGFWLRRSEPPVVPGVATQQAEASDAATLTASRDVAIAPVERIEAPAMPPPAPDASNALAHVRGRCVDEAGKPLVMCQAKLHAFGGNSNRMALQGTVEWKDPEPCVTGADGRFDIAFAPPSGMQFTLDVQADGRVPRTGRWGTIQPAQVIELGEVTMTTGFEVHGRVVDDRGAPVAKVGVLLKNLPLPLASDMSANDTRFGWSAADGAFRVEVPIPLGTWGLGVQAAGMRLVSPDRVIVTANSAEPVVVTVRRMPSIEGRVVDEQGLPVARVYLSGELHRSGRMASAWSRKDGTFVLHAVDDEPKPVRLVIDDPGPCEPWWSDERLWEWGSKDVTVVLKQALSFELTVVERQTGAPVTQYAVCCYHEKANSSLQRDLRLGGEHEGGRVTVDRVWRGKNFLQVIPIDKALQPSAMLEFEASDAGVAPLRVELDRLQRVAVRAVTVGKEPAVGSKVEVVVKGTMPFDASAPAQESRSGNSGYGHFPGFRQHELVGSAVTGADGRAELLVTPGARGLVVRVTGPHPPIVVDPAVLVPGDDFVVVVPDGGGIVGKAALRGLDPTRITVHPRPSGGQEPPRRSRDEGVLQVDGGFTLRGLAPGAYQLRLSYAVRFTHEHGSSGGSTDLDVTVPEVTVLAGRDTAVEIDATALAPATLRGRLLLDGAVPAAARAFVRAERGAQFGQFVPAADGVFEATGLLPGTYRAWLVVGDFQAGGGDCIAADDTFLLAAGEQLTRDFAFTRRRLVVTILQADAKTPAAGMQVMANGQDFFTRLVADDHGVLVIDPVPLGRINLQVVGSTRQDPVEMPVGKREHALTLTLPAPKEPK